MTEIVSYGTLYYAFTMLASTIAYDTGWSQGAAVISEQPRSTSESQSTAGALLTR